MIDLQGQTESVLAAMGWVKPRYGMGVGAWFKSPERIYPNEYTGIGWVASHVIPWATERGWIVELRRYRRVSEMLEREHCSAYVETDHSYYVGESEWAAGEGDGTVEALIPALYRALIEERELLGS